MLLTHSSRVKLAKIIFPIIAIGAVVYLMSIDWSNDAKIVGEFAEEDKVFQENSASVEKPKLDITTTAGDNYKLEATSIESVGGSIQSFSGGDVAGDLTVDQSHWAVQANTSTADVENQIVEFNDDVTGVLDNEFTFSTDHLKADGGTQIINGNKRVEIEGKLGKVAADNFEISGKPDQRILKLSGNVVGQMKADKAEVKKVPSEQVDSEEVGIDEVDSDQKNVEQDNEDQLKAEQ